MKDRAPSLAAGDIARATGGELLSGAPEACCGGVSIDSRDMDRGNLFVAIRGENFDGHDFVGTAVQGGAAGVVIEKRAFQETEGIAGDIPVIAVDDTVQALGDMAAFWRKKFDVPVVAVTGSSGKTTTKEMAASILSLSRNILKNRGNFNNLIGLPLTLLQIHDRHEVIIVEMGTNRRGEIERLTEIAAPDIGIVTNVGPAHLEGLQSVDLVAREKGDLFRCMKQGGTAIINSDDPAVCAMQGRWQGKSVTYGMAGDSLVRAGDITIEAAGGTGFGLVLAGKNERVRIALPGRHNVSNALAAAACSWALGIAYDQICRGLEAFRQLPGRMSLRPLKNGVVLIDDSYNANPASTREAIETVHAMKGDRAAVVVMGDMLELGADAAAWHEEMGRLMARRGVDRIFLTGDLVRSVLKGAEAEGMPRDRIIYPITPGGVVDRLTGSVRQGDSILVKGSRGMRMEAYVQAIVDAFGEDVS